MHKRFLIFLIQSLFLISCFLDDGRPSGVLYEYDLKHEGMVLIGAKGQSAILGANSVSAKMEERPLMKVKFNYNFSISKHEVTKFEYSKLMGGTSEKGEENHPITNLTYYDAVLFANARSKAEGFDTAYTYSKITFNESGFCTNLEALNTRFEIDAYRLPTEAEWVFVASQNWQPNQAWNNESSNYLVQEVCTADINDVGVCDMAGNVMEWVNDWLGYFKDTVIFNFVGAPDGATLGERVLKGGSYRNAPDDINVYSRGDVYKVTSSTRAAYVGFRLAFGAIPNPVWMSSTGVASESRVIPLSTSASIKIKTGTYKTKLVFRNNETQNL
ncbi:MAG TPA: SUMF1/EgtB/PvdO family nonheme iron enzyme, partial [Fibrobacter sp.]|nr:SUMF1/EgtB/PvdO family nonheme iron enzyme [Fibrobacter sp.]